MYHSSKIDISATYSTVVVYLYLQFPMARVYSKLHQKDMAFKAMQTLHKKLCVYRMSS